MTAHALVLAGLLLAGAARAEAPGGSGVILPPGGNAVPTCFATGSAAVPEICTTLQVHWKLSALMGEPVAHFALVWSLGAVQVREGAGVVTYGLGQLPEAVAQAARRSQLMVKGLATFQGPQGQPLAVEVDTGAPSRPGGKPSFSVPGSPDWDRFIFGASQRPGAVTGGRLSTGWAAACEDQGRSHVEPAQAKSAMRRGMRLTGLVICPGTTVQVDALEHALRQHCRTAPQAAWCEKKRPPSAPERPTPSQGDALDKAADQLAIQGTHARLLADHRRQAQAACAQELAPLQACRSAGCPSPSGPTEAQCTAVPRKPSRGLGPVLSSVDNRPCNAQCQSERAASREASRRREAREAQAFEEKLAAWESAWGSLARACREHGRAREQQNQCLLRAEATCNPQGLTAQRCLDRRLADAPGLAAAKTEFDKGVRERQRGGAATSRFLD